MTKLTQKQRRDAKKKLYVNISELLYKDALFDNVKLIYPNINIITLTETNDLSNKIAEYTVDDNNIVFIFNNNNQINIKTVYSDFMILKEVPTNFWIKYIGHIAFMVIRSSAVMLCPASYIDKSNILIEELKSLFKPMTKDCLICFHKFYFEEQRFCCCNCRMPMCIKCLEQYLESNSGWCPYCTRHLVIKDVGKDDFSEYGELFEMFIRQEMYSSLDPEGVKDLKWSDIESEWRDCITDFIMSQNGYGII